MTDRILVAARLSRIVKGRDQTSIERQDLAAERYAADHGQTIVATAADAGVSGSVSPLKRPALGPYFRPPLLGTWDEVVASALDRLGRNARDLADLRAFAEDHGKRITILSPRLTWPPAPDDLTSGLIWDVVGRLAEIELRLTSKRYRDTRAYLASRGSLLGRPAWGFRIVGSKAAKSLAPDPARVGYLNELIDRALAGETLADLVRWLDAEAVADPAARPRHGGKWSPKSLSQILRNPSLAGRRQDDDGHTLVHHEPVISAEKFDRLQAALDASPKRRGPTRNAPALLTDVLHCSLCGRIMHARRTYGRRRKDGTRPLWVGYRCDGTPAEPSTCRNMIPAAEIEDWVNGTMSDPGMYGNLKIIERTFVPPRGHAAEIAEIEADLRSLDWDDPDFAERQAALLAERARLTALGTEPAHYEDRETDETVADRWTRLTTAERRDYLRRADARIEAASRADAPWTFVVERPNVLRVA